MLVRWQNIIEFEDLIPLTNWLFYRFMIFSGMLPFFINLKQIIEDWRNFQMICFFLLKGCCKITSQNLIFSLCNSRVAFCITIIVFVCFITFGPCKFLLLFGSWWVSLHELPLWNYLWSYFYKVIWNSLWINSSDILKMVLAPPKKFYHQKQWENHKLLFSYLSYRLIHSLELALTTITLSNY